MDVSKHAQKRLKERLGLNRKASFRHAQKAFKEGICPKDYYYRDIGQKYALMQEKDESKMFLFYLDHIYVFGLGPLNQPVLITVYDPVMGEWARQYVSGALLKVRKLSGRART